MEFKKHSFEAASVTVAREREKHSPLAGRTIVYEIAYTIVRACVSGFMLAAGRAPGIVAESPQDLHWQIRGLGAESPAPALRAGGAPICFCSLRPLVSRRVLIYTYYQDNEGGR
jgi:hypothetical protein